MMRGKLHGKFRSWRFFFIDEGETKLAPFITVFASTPPRVNGEMFLKRNFHSRRACNVIANMTRYKYQRFRFLMSFAFWSKGTKYRKHSTESQKLLTQADHDLCKSVPRNLWSTFIFDSRKDQISYLVWDERVRLKTFLRILMPISRSD